MSKKTAIFLLGVFALLSLSVTAAKAAGYFGLEQTANRAGYEVQATDPSDTIRTVITAILGFVAVVFFVLMLYAGFTWMIARGKEERVSLAKDMFEGAVIGLVLIFAAYALTNFILNRLSNEPLGCCSISDPAGNVTKSDTTNANCDSSGGKWSSVKCEEKAAQ